MASQCYAKMLQPQGSARFGKLTVGRIVPVEEDMLTAWVKLGIAEESSEKAYTEYKEHMASLGGGGERGAELRKLAQEKSDSWDTATHRDAMTASEANLRKVMEAGIPLVNLDQLRDESGVALHPGSTAEDIIEARSRLAARDPLRDHTQSSVFGGGSHYYTPAPLNDPGDSKKTLASGEVVDAVQAPPQLTNEADIIAASHDAQAAANAPAKRGRPKKDS